MGRKINLMSDRVMPLKERCRKRDAEDREHFLENFPTELARKECQLIPTPAKEVATVVHMDNGYTFTEYKSLAKMSVPFDRGQGMSKRRTLPDIFEVTEVVYSGVGVEDQDDDM